MQNSQNIKEASRHSSQTVNWLIPAGLILLSLIPGIAGIVRLTQLGAELLVTSENARFIASPWPISLHVLSAMLYSIIGSFQFTPALRTNYPKWHQHSGRCLIPLGFLVALTGIWMTLYYPPANFDGTAVFILRLVVGLAMLASLVLGVAAIRERDFPKHGDWMTRAYALGLGAGTQVLTHLPWFLFPSIQGELARSICMGLGWMINIAIAEWIIRRRNSHREPVALIRTLYVSNRTRMPSTLTNNKDQK